MVCFFWVMNFAKRQVLPHYLGGYPWIRFKLDRSGGQGLKWEHHEIWHL